MPTTLNLLEDALKIQKQSHWARALNITDAAFSQAKKRGRLSPTMAGALASQLKRDPIAWTALAAVEAEPDSPLKAKMIKTLGAVRTWSLGRLLKFKVAA